MRLDRLYVLATLFEIMSALTAGCSAARASAVSVELNTVAPTPPAEHDDCPLKLGDSWTYLVGAYDGPNPSEIATSTYVYTDTVIAVSTVSSYTVATIHREPSAEFAIYIPPSLGQLFHGPPTREDYWLLVDGNRIYEQTRTLDVSNSEQKGSLRLILPLQVGAKWHESDEMTKLDPDFQNRSMLYEVVKTDTVIVPAGRFENCYLLTETVGGTTMEDWFCPGIGYVDQKADHHGTPFGDRRVLIAYHFE